MVRNKLLERLVLIFAIIVVAGVFAFYHFTNEVKTPKHENKKEPSVSIKGDVRAVLEPSGVQNSDYLFIYQIQNTTNKQVSLDFATSQNIDYQVLNNQQKVVYTYGQDQMFAQVIGQKTIPSQDNFVSEIHVKGLVKGHYTLKVWVPVTKGDKYPTELAFDVQ